ncbi:MAG TPA: DUF6498-containing protein [Candidatus Thermoplasmatota archaeon]|nr:DUF6498-containing protein [Candidatus Thermoplasmatota archaeon]
MPAPSAPFCWSLEMAPVLPNEVVGAAPVPVPVPVPVAEPDGPDPAEGPPASLWVLLAANLVPLLGVLLFGWDLGLVMLLYWAESAVILAFSLAKLAITAGWGALFLIPFFVVHAGLFMVVHLVFLVVLFVREPEAGWLSLARDLAIALAAFAISHGYSFWANFRQGGESFKGHGDVMGAFYKRIVVMHLTIIFGAFLTFSLGSPVWAVVLLVALKTAVDAGAHLLERRRHSKAAPADAPTTS